MNSGIRFVSKRPIDRNPRERTAYMASMATDNEVRFEFGLNWTAFLSTLDEQRIRTAEATLQEMLSISSLDGRSFLDVGCGSGLFSLAAMRLGATRVHSFDYDRQSVQCTQELRRRFFPDAAFWSVENGDVLDEAYIKSLGSFDVVYAWGVLHHTGDMWKALEHVAAAVADEGKLFLAIYYDAGRSCRVWSHVKKTYCELPAFLKPPYLLAFAVLIEAWTGLKDILQGKPPWDHWVKYQRSRGMSRWHDIKDWVGGYPYQFAKVDDLFDFCRKLGFRLDRLRTTRGKGNNQLVFMRM